jgi:flavodoxin
MAAALSPAPFLASTALAAIVLAAALLAPGAPARAAGDDSPFGRSLVVVFSQTGNTWHLAEIISQKIGAGIFRIEPTEPFPADEREIIGFEERRRAEGIEPELATEPPDFSNYDLVLLGSPVWFGERPDLVAAFLLAADFQGADVALFATSGTHPGNILPSLKALVKNGEVLAPTLIQKRDDDHSEAAINQRIDDWLEAVRLARQ